VWLERRAAGRFDIDFSSANQDPSPSGLAYSWSCDGAGNAGHYCDHGADSLLFRAMASPVADGRLWQDFLERVEENAPAAFLYTQAYVAGVNRRFREVIIRPISPWGSLWRWPAPPS
jgi:ABC-type transport system substrate-binding protein